MKLMEEGIYVNGDGDRLRGVTIFNVSIEEPVYVEAVLRNKAQEVVSVAREYIDDLENEMSSRPCCIIHYNTR